jgi:XRE family transcriptional regulator, aerobic/anaerobic benzoate catabolism transcriptional regulator
MTRAVRRQLGMTVQTLRDKRAMTQEVLAKKAGISRGYLARVETGRHEPTLTTLRKLAKALGVPVTQLLE